MINLDDVSFFVEQEPIETEKQIIEYLKESLSA